MEKTSKIESMTCMQCEAHVKKALESVESAVVSYEKGQRLLP